MAVFAFAKEFPVVIVETSQGSFEIELYPEKAPLSVENFVIQAGGLNQDLSEKPTNDPIKNEANNGLSNLKGTVALARTEEVDSASSHFFVNLKDNLRLDYVDPAHFGYAVFGKIVQGYEVVEEIEKQAVQSVGEYDNVPVTPIVMISVHRK